MPLGREDPREGAAWAFLGGFRRGMVSNATRPVRTRRLPIEPQLKTIDDGLRQLIRGVARPYSPEGGRPNQQAIARAIGETLEELSLYCPEAHHIKRIKVKRDAPRGGVLRGWRYHVTVIFERDPAARTEGDET